MHPLLNALAIATAAAVVNIDAYGTVVTSTSSGDTTAGFRFKANGTLWRLHRVDGGSLNETQIDVTTDWIIPNLASGRKTYHVKAEQNAQTGGGNLSGALSSWIEINGDIDWHITRPNAAGNGTSTWDLAFSISSDGGSTTIDTSDGAGHTADAVRNV